MLHDYGLPKYFWAEALNTACYITNRALIISGIKKTPYEIWRGRKPNLSYFHPFGCKCFALNTKDHLVKFDAKSDECVFLGYSMTSRAYRIFNKRTFKVEESINVIFDESANECSDEIDEDDFGLGGSYDLPRTSNTEKSEPRTIISEDQDKAVSTTNSPIEEDHDVRQPPPHIAKRHPSSLMIGGLNEGMVTRSKNSIVHTAFVSLVEPKNVLDALNDENWNAAMNEEMVQFE
ncbi:unnamed protein product [Linum trigynum]|uniref:Retroviral polymerase SH3-like domain-containing protein n=1 Tax=Linum trigynum TaxID=586398 RepID=A0AAV2CRI0_9ROSI